jgi:hypothetical protein
MQLIILVVLLCACYATAFTNLQKFDGTTWVAALEVTTENVDDTKAKLIVDGTEVEYNAFVQDSDGSYSFGMTTQTEGSTTAPTLSEGAVKLREDPAKETNSLDTVIMKLLAMANGLSPFLQPAERNERRAEEFETEFKQDESLAALLDVDAISATEYAGYFKSADLGANPFEKIAAWKTAFDTKIKTKGETFVSHIYVAFPMQEEVTLETPRDPIVAAPPLVAQATDDNADGTIAPPPAEVKTLLSQLSELKKHHKRHGKHNRHVDTRREAAQARVEEQGGFTPLPSAGADDVDRFNEWNKDQVGLTGKAVLVGGQNIGRPGIADVGTLGGLLTAAGTRPDNYRLFGLTNHHVLQEPAGADTLSPLSCNPTPPFHPTAGTCDVLGKPIAGCCKAADRRAVPVVGKMIDYAIVEIDPTVRWKHRCAVRGKSPSSGKPAAIVDVTGTGTAFVDGNINDVVSKYGTRTHWTTGKILHVYTLANGPKPTADQAPEGHRYSVIGTHFPDFWDDPAAIPATGEKNPTNEPGFHNTAIRDPLEALIQTVPKPGAGRNYNPAEARLVFTCVLAGGGIPGGGIPGGLFLYPGDSGSLLMKGGLVLGLLNSFRWEFDATNTVPCDSSLLQDGSEVQNWPHFRAIAFAYDISEVLSLANTALAALPTPVPTVSVCTEAARPVPTLASPCVYTSGFLGLFPSCTFPHACVVSGWLGFRSCVARTP